MEIEFNNESGEIIIPGRTTIPGPYEYWINDETNDLEKVTYTDTDIICTKLTPQTMRKFAKHERSTWAYYWAHWCAFQMVAINLRIWKFKYLFHDWYKPWLKMLGMNYNKIQRIHRYNSNHHIEWFEDLCEHNGKSLEAFDLDALIIDWECSQYTKENCPRNARQEMEYVCNTTELVPLRVFLRKCMSTRLDELGL